jgi:hypothetical protein
VKKKEEIGWNCITGEAPINKFVFSSIIYDLNPALTLYGGSNQESNSGIMRFVRIEFAGKKVKALHL